MPNTHFRLPGTATAACGAEPYEFDACPLSIELTRVDCPECVEYLHHTGRVVQPNKERNYFLCDTEDSYDQTYRDYHKEFRDGEITEEEFKIIKRQYADYIKGRR